MERQNGNKTLETKREVECGKITEQKHGRRNMGYNSVTCSLYSAHLVGYRILLDEGSG